VSKRKVTRSLILTQKYVISYHQYERDLITLLVILREDCPEVRRSCRYTDPYTRHCVEGLRLTHSKRSDGVPGEYRV
jgi:hypothetical protein